MQWDYRVLSVSCSISHSSAGCFRCCVIMVLSQSCPKAKSPASSCNECVTKKIVIRVKDANLCGREWCCRRDQTLEAKLEQISPCLKSQIWEVHSAVSVPGESQLLWPPRLRPHPASETQGWGRHSPPLSSLRGAPYSNQPKSVVAINFQPLAGSESKG